MTTSLLIAAEEWRYWFRTKLGASAAFLALMLIGISISASLSQQAHEKNTRERLQVKAEQTFREQPARHPHRMVHYGHYVFRAPTALAALDPGVDPYTGTVMFLEGHRQNSATFSPSYDGAQAGPFARLTPALTYQLLVPLILIAMGFGAVAREREAITDRQLITSGISPIEIWSGKSLALVSVIIVMLLPLLVGVVLSANSTQIGLGFITLYALYLLSWGLIITAVSTYSRSTSMSLLSLLIVWVVVCILLPRAIVSAATVTTPVASQIETDMNVIVALRSVGDGHNANDPAFNRLKANLLKEYKVERVEDLPINFRGSVAQAAEADLTSILNEYAEKRIATQVTQTDWVKSFELVSPFLILQSASMVAAGTDAKTHHRFLREAETVRFEFVQGLNKAHENKMAYSDDINRSSDPSAEQRTRVDPQNWRVLRDFRFVADPVAHRLKRLTSSIFGLLAWVSVFAVIGVLGAKRLSEADHG